MKCVLDYYIENTRVEGMIELIVPVRVPFDPTYEKRMLEFIETLAQINDSLSESGASVRWRVTE